MDKINHHYTIQQSESDDNNIDLLSNSPPRRKDPLNGNYYTLDQKIISTNAIIFTMCT
jgi:hypothetical protein